MKIYTKGGDTGQTGIMGGARLSKTNPRIAAIGEVDELNAAIGWARVVAGDSSLDPLLAKVQSWLFELGSELASPGDARFETIQDEMTEQFEIAIDGYTSQLPELKNFILPGGSEFAARLHIARSVGRRAERAVVELSECESVRLEVTAFLNRLADLLFVAARTANFDQNVLDVTWTRGS